MRDELKGIRMVGQSPKLTERWDDKANTNLWLASQEGLETAFPKSRIVYKNDMENLKLEQDGIGWPRILKPIRGRGSHGVAVIEDEKGFQDHIKTLFAESDAVLVEVSLSFTLWIALLIDSGVLHRRGNHGDGHAPWRVHRCRQAGNTLVTASRTTYRS
jgi:biotin carboxylase